MTTKMEAKYYEALPAGKVKCVLCPHECIIQPGNRGICRIRYNSNGILLAEAYRIYSAIHFDPIEKKPLYHFYPGKEILSVGSVGCNLHCKWCQNCDISQKGVNESIGLSLTSPEKLVEMALNKPNTIGIAYTYNEPSITLESVIEVTTLCKEKDLKNVMVTNGYIGKQALADCLELIDAFNIDVKAFSDDVYRKFTGSSLNSILNNIITVKKAGRHVELTYLVVTDINDDLEQFGNFVKWIASETGKDTVLHISRYFPRYKMDKPPTTSEKMISLAQLASEKLSYVYTGNMSSGGFEDTKCSVCNSILISRNGYSISINKACKSGICPQCQTKIFVDD